MADDLYDELTRRRIDRASRSSGSAGPGSAGRRVGVTRRAVGGGALLGAVALGLQEVFDPPAEEPIVEEIPEGADDDLAPVTLLLVPGAPRLSRARVRPWLL